MLSGEVPIVREVVRHPRPPVPCAHLFGHRLSSGGHDLIEDSVVGGERVRPDPLPVNGPAGLVAVDGPACLHRLDNLLPLLSHEG